MTIVETMKQTIHSNKLWYNKMRFHPILQKCLLCFQYVAISPEMFSTDQKKDPPRSIISYADSHMLTCEII